MTQPEKPELTQAAKLCIEGIVTQYTADLLLEVRMHVSEMLRLNREAVQAAMEKATIPEDRTP